MRVKPLGTGKVLVESEYRIDLARLSGFRIDRTPNHIHKLEGTDANGVLPLNIAADGPGSTISPARRVTPPLRLSYTLDVETEPRAMTTGTVSLEDRFWGRGASLLLLPIGLTADLTRVQLVIDGEEIKAAQAASSFGVGRVREARISLTNLANLTFVAGSLGGAILDTPEGHDEAAWLGYPAFDPRPVAGELALLRTMAGETLKQHTEGTFSYLFGVTPRTAGNVSVKPTVNGLTLHIGPAEPWNGKLRLAATQHFFQRWVGGQMLVADRAHESEGLWFAAGVSRYLAAKTLTRTGFLKSTELRDEVEGHEEIARGSANASTSNSDLAALSTPESRSVLAARGFLYAAHVDGFVREHSHGQKGIEEVLKKLIEAPKTEGRYVSRSLWLDAVTGEAGTRDDQAFDTIVRDGKVPTLPPKTFGLCLMAQNGTYTRWESGFDAVASFASGVVEGLVKGGAAEKAGLREGEYLESATIKSERGTATQQITVLRDGKPMLLTYPVKGTTVPGQRWTATKTEDCWK